MLGNDLQLRVSPQIFFSGSTFFTLTKGAGPRDGDPFLCRGWSFVQHGFFFFSENSGDITSQLDEMLWRILSKVASFLFLWKESPPKFQVTSFHISCSAQWGIPSTNPRHWVAPETLCQVLTLSPKRPQRIQMPGFLQDEMLLIYLVWTLKNSTLAAFFFLDLSTCKSLLPGKQPLVAVHFPATWETPKKPALAPFAFKKKGTNLPMVFPGWLFW